MSWIKDIQSYVDRIPFGKVNIELERVGRKTVKVTTYGKETLNYRTTDEALEDINLILKRLSDNEFEGTATLELQYKKGKIKLVGIYDQKITRY